MGCGVVVKKAIWYSKRSTYAPFGLQAYVKVQVHLFHRVLSEQQSLSSLFHGVCNGDVHEVWTVNFRRRHACHHPTSGLRCIRRDLGKDRLLYSTAFSLSMREILVECQDDAHCSKQRSWSHKAIHTRNFDPRQKKRVTYERSYHVSNLSRYASPKSTLGNFSSPAMN